MKKRKQKNTVATSILLLLCYRYLSNFIKNFSISVHFDAMLPHSKH